MKILLLAFTLIIIGCGKSGSGNGSTSPQNSINPTTTISELTFEQKECVNENYAQLDQSDLAVFASEFFAMTKLCDVVPEQVFKHLEEVESE